MPQLTKVCSFSWQRERMTKRRDMFVLHWKGAALKQERANHERTHWGVQSEKTISPEDASNFLNQPPLLSSSKSGNVCGSYCLTRTYKKPLHLFNYLKWKRQREWAKWVKTSWTECKILRTFTVRLSYLIREWECECAEADCISPFKRGTGAFKVDGVCFHNSKLRLFPLISHHQLCFCCLPCLFISE